MSAIEVSRVIAAPAELLYDIVSDLPRMGELSPENTGGVWLDDASGPAVGARFRGTNSDHKKKHWATVVTIDEADRGRAFSFRVAVGPIKISRWAYAFEPVDEGTRVTESWTDMRSWFAKKIGGLASGVSDRPEFNRESMETTLTNLARAARSTGAPDR